MILPVRGKFKKKKTYGEKKRENRKTKRKQKTEKREKRETNKKIETKRIKRETRKKRIKTEIISRKIKIKEKREKETEKKNRKEPNQEKNHRIFFLYFLIFFSQCVPLEEFTENYEKIILFLKEKFPGVCIVLISPPATTRNGKIFFFQ